jgi:plasmid stabilization system protein ParE
MSYNVVIFPSAQKDIDQAYRWLVQHTPKAATLWHFELMGAIASLEAFPYRCPLARENKYFKDELRQLLCGKYRIVYTVKDEEVHIIHVRHIARKPVKPKRIQKKK